MKRWTNKNWNFSKNAVFRYFRVAARAIWLTIIEKAVSYLLVLSLNFNLSTGGGSQVPSNFEAELVARRRKIAHSAIHPFNLNLAISLIIHTFHPLEILTDRFIHLYIRLYVQAFIHVTKEALIQPFFYPFIHSVVKPAIYLSVCPSIHSAFHQQTNLAIHPSSISTKTWFIYPYSEQCHYI